MSSNDPTISDVEALGSTGWKQLSDTKKQALLDDAIAETDSIYTERVSTLPTLDGDRTVFIKNLAAHKWELAEGGEVQSESSTGGSTNYQSSNPEDYLTLTRYGETAIRHLRDEQSIGVVRSH